MHTPLALTLILPLVAAAGAAAAAPPTMTLTSSAFDPGGAIPRPYQTVSPPLDWTPVAGAKAYAVTMQDPDAPIGRPFVHWVVWNIPGSASGLPQGGLGGVVEGDNDTGARGYFGPHPPFGTHHYHIKVYALDAPLGLAPGAELPALTAAMRGHVLAQGELVGTFPPKGK
jgi:Raf kinase inhibitor-like YbhB/YbcL family protein